MTTLLRTRVIKVGGSLFDFPQLVSALDRLFDGLSPAAHVVIAGGGPWADAIRDADDRYRIGESRAHELCLYAMRVSARLLASLMPDWPLETSWDRIRDWTGTKQSQGDVRVLDVFSFLNRIEPNAPGNAIPRDWTATSDSIAARVAHALGADELLLLKSVTVALDSSIEQAAADGYLDDFFPRAAHGLPRIGCVNLCDPHSRMIELARD